MNYFLEATDERKRDIKSLFSETGDACKAKTERQTSSSFDEWCKRPKWLRLLEERMLSGGDFI